MIGVMFDEKLVCPNPENPVVAAEEQRRKRNPSASTGANPASLSLRRKAKLPTLRMPSSTLEQEDEPSSSCCGPKTEATRL